MKELLLIDANSLIHRAFHALPPFTSLKGEPTGALYGLASILLKIKKEQKPDYWVAAFDRPEPTFRKEIFKEYKIQRPAAPQELISQIIRAHELFEKFGIKFFEQPGFEADDIIASLVKKFKKEKDLKIIILTGDLDTLQLVTGDKVVVEIPKKGVSEMVVYNEKEVGKRYSLNPEQLSDYKALVGDPSDNIPGVFGIGPKTASALLGQFYNLENLYKKIKDPAFVRTSAFGRRSGLRPTKSVGKRNLFQKLLNSEKQAFFSKNLVLLKSDIKTEIFLEDLVCRDLGDSLIEYFKQSGFQSLISRISFHQKSPTALF